MGLYPRWRSILSLREQASLSPDFFPIGYDAKNDEIGSELVHKIGACGGPNPEWLHQEWPSSPRHRSTPEQCWSWSARGGKSCQGPDFFELVCEGGKQLSCYRLLNTRVGVLLAVVEQPHHVRAGHVWRWSEAVGVSWSCQSYVLRDKHQYP